jgi:hypothetical protein
MRFVTVRYRCYRRQEYKAIWIREWIGHSSLPMNTKYTHLDDEYKLSLFRLSKT